MQAGARNGNPSLRITLSNPAAAHGKGRTGEALGTDRVEQMTRDLILVACVLACLALSFRHPFAGVLTWAWIALMQPQTEVYGVISSRLAP